MQSCWSSYADNFLLCVKLAWTVFTTLSTSSDLGVLLLSDKLFSFICQTAVPVTWRRWRSVLWEDTWTTTWQSRTLQRGRSPEGRSHEKKNTVDHQVETFVIGETRQTLHTTCRFKNVVLTWWKRLMQSWDVEAKALFSVMFCYYNNKADFFTIIIVKPKQDVWK